MKLSSINAKAARAVVLLTASVVLVLAVVFVVADFDRTPFRHLSTGCVVSISVDLGPEIKSIVVPPMVGKVILEEDSITKHQTIKVVQVNDRCY